MDTTAEAITEPAGQEMAVAEPITEPTAQEMAVAAEATPPPKTYTEADHKVWQKALNKAQERARVLEQQARLNEDLLSEVKTLQKTVSATMAAVDVLFGRQEAEEEPVTAEKPRTANPITQYRQTYEQEQAARVRQAAEAINALLESDGDKLTGKEMRLILQQPTAEQALQSLKQLIASKKQEEPAADQQTEVERRAEELTQQRLRDRGLLMGDRGTPTGGSGPKSYAEAARLYREGKLSDKEFKDWKQRQ